MIISFLNKYVCDLSWKPSWGGKKNKPTCCIFHTNAIPDSFAFVTVVCTELLGLFLYTYVINKLTQNYNTYWNKKYDI